LLTVSQVRTRSYFSDNSQQISRCTFFEKNDEDDADDYDEIANRL